MAVLRLAAAVLTAAACSASLMSAPAVAVSHPSATRSDPIKVIASGLDGPYELSKSHGKIYVTESDAGKITAVNPRTGATKTVVSGLGANLVAGAVRIGNRYVLITGGESEASTPAGGLPLASVLVARAGHKPYQLADLLAYERKHNPDGQAQVGDDALSNPFFVLPYPRRHGLVLVADGGANDVLKVDRNGKVSTFFVPPTVNTGACKGLPNNDTSTVGCDAVPTGLAYGPGNTLYLSALTAFAPGEGRVYVLNANTGKLLRTIKGFSAPTGVAVDRRNGTVYVSELLEGVPQGPPPVDFDPSTIGRIVKVTRGGDRSYAQVTMPSGLLFTQGQLYSSAWSVAGIFLGIPHAGQVVRVGQSAFHPSS